MVRLELAQIVGAWPIGVSLAAALAQGLYAGRRRTVLNEALHELRRPLQALVLTAPGPHPPEPAAIRGSVDMAATALDRLEREINGEAVRAVRAPISVLPLLEATIGRWRARAELAGGSLALREQAGETRVDGDRGEIARALDNLVANAIEHGGSEIVVEARAQCDRLRVAVVDSGRGAGGAPPSDRAGFIARFAGRRRGHGLRIVRRIAAAHGGDFRLCCSRHGTEAVLELPLSGGAS